MKTCSKHQIKRAIGAECRECVNARSRAWYRKPENAAKVAARHRAYYLANRARIAEYNRAAYARRKEAEGAR